VKTGFIFEKISRYIPKIISIAGLACATIVVGDVFSFYLTPREKEIIYVRV